MNTFVKTWVAVLILHFLAPMKFVLEIPSCFPTGKCILRQASLSGEGNRYPINRVDSGGRRSSYCSSDRNRGAADDAHCAGHTAGGMAQ